MFEIKFEKEKNRAVVLEQMLVVGKCEYIVLADKWNIIHTEVNPNYQGKGIARKLVECVIKNAKIDNKKVVADCSYAKKIIGKNNLS